MHGLQQVAQKAATRAHDPAADEGVISGFGGNMFLAGTLTLATSGDGIFQVPLGTAPFVTGSAAITGILTDRVRIAKGEREGETGAPFTLELTPAEGTEVLSKGGISAVTIFGDDGRLMSAAPVRITLVTPLRIALGDLGSVPASISTEFDFVPEPATAVLLAGVAATLAVIARRRFRG